MNVDKLEYTNDVIELYCDETYRYVFVHFTNTPSFPQYVFAMQKTVDLLREKKMNYLIADVRQWKNHSNGNKEWRDGSLIQLIECGIRKYGIISDNNEEINPDIDQPIVSTEFWQIKVRHCSSFKDAEDWILRIE